MSKAANPPAAPLNLGSGCSGALGNNSPVLNRTSWNADADVITKLSDLGSSASGIATSGNRGSVRCWVQFAVFQNMNSVLLTAIKMEPSGESTGA
jgi:hypothetical protein